MMKRSPYCPAADLILAIAISRTTAGAVGQFANISEWLGALWCEPGTQTVGIYDAATKSRRSSFKQAAPVLAATFQESQPAVFAAGLECALKR